MLVSMGVVVRDEVWQYVCGTAVTGVLCTGLSLVWFVLQFVRGCSLLQGIGWSRGVSVCMCACGWQCVSTVDAVQLILLWWCGMVKRVDGVPQQLHLMQAAPVVQGRPLCYV